MKDQVIVDWKRIVSAASPRMKWTRCLYAFSCSVTGAIEYIGKADRCTASERIYATDKKRVSGRLEGVGSGRFHVLVGKLKFGPGRRNSLHNLADVERLLIYELQPHGNHASKRSGTYWDGLLVRCVGDWPHSRDTFRSAA